MTTAEPSRPVRLPPFAALAPPELSEERRTHLSRMAEELGPWPQGPFPLGPDLVVGNGCRSDLRWSELANHLPEDISGKRVLVVGSRAGFDAFMYHHLGAGSVLACESGEPHRQAVFIDSVYRTGIAFDPIGWQDLRREVHGEFDIIHCDGVAHRELHPMMLLGRLARLMSPQGSAYIAAPLLPDDALSDYVRFVQEEYRGDAGWWWLPGRKALRRMLRVAGFAIREEFETPGDVDDGRSPRNSYFRATPALRTARDFPVAAKAAPFAGDPERVVVRFAHPPGHFYSAEPDLRELASEPTRSRVWPATPHPTPGIDWREAAQAALCTEVFARQEPLAFPAFPTEDPTEYHGTNSQLSPLDAWVLQAMLRMLEPRRVIEVGSGFSSLMTARVNRELFGGRMRFTCIEPHPRPFLLEGVPGISDLRVEEVQDTPLDVFDELGPGDVLFVDTSHTVKTGGEVPWIFSQIVPRLHPGVALHVHDVYLPGEYPRQWVLDEGRNWNENYLVQAFLAFNAGFEVLLGVQWMIQNRPQVLLETFPGLIDPRTVTGPVRPPMGHYLLGEHSGSSLWLRRRGAVSRTP